MTTALSEMECLENAVQYCRKRAAMSWTDKERDRWNKMAQWNLDQIEKRQKPSES